jgi:type I restriction enzyme S subunit
MALLIEELKLQPYEKYKKSGVEWLREIPEKWNIKKLGFIGVFSASGIDKYVKQNESRVKIINFTDVYGNENRKIDSSNELMIVTTPEENRKKHLVKKGDLIFLPSSETYEDLGLSVLIDEELENTSFSYHIIRLQFKCEMDHSFKKYFTNNAYVLNQFARAGKGTTRKIIGKNVFKNILVVIPTILEQTAIAKLLEDKTAKIDRAISIKQKQIQLLKERKQISIHKAVTRGINPDVRLKNSDIEWIGQIPEHWEISKNKNLFSERNSSGNFDLPLLSISIHTAISTEELDSDNNIRGRIKIEDKSIYKLVEINDIAFNMMRAWQGAIGAVKVKGMVSPAYIVAMPKFIIKAEFFEYLFRTDAFIQQMDRYSRGITDFRKRLYWNEFKQLDALVPPFDEQIEIVEYIGKLTTKIETAVALKEKEIEKLKEYKTSLINSVVTGKVKVT